MKIAMSEQQKHRDETAKRRISTKQHDRTLGVVSPPNAFRDPSLPQVTLHGRVSANLIAVIPHVEAPAIFNAVESGSDELAQ